MSVGGEKQSVGKEGRMTQEGEPVRKEENQSGETFRKEEENQSGETVRKEEEKHSGQTVRKEEKQSGPAAAYLHQSSGVKSDPPWTKARICSYCSLAWLSFTRSILFWRMRMCFSFMISMAAKCSDVWGWGHDSFPAGMGTGTDSVRYSF